MATTNTVCPMQFGRYQLDASDLIATQQDKQRERVVIELLHIGMSKFSFVGSAIDSYKITVDARSSQPDSSGWRYVSDLFLDQCHR